jgi:hypothetical protein
MQWHGRVVRRSAAFRLAVPDMRDSKPTARRMRKQDENLLNVGNRHFRSELSDIRSGCVPGSARDVTHSEKPSVPQR